MYIIKRQNPIIPYFMLDDSSITPKYMQLADSITAAIDTGKIQKNNVLPSINELAVGLKISRDTVEKSYKHLKKTGILKSVPKLGYFINNETKQELKVLLLFNKLSNQKKVMYDAFSNSLGDNTSIDFVIYNNDFNHFKGLIQQSKNKYTHYVVVPHFIDEVQNANEILNNIPSDKLIIMDRMMPGIVGKFGAVYENFEKNIYGALVEALPQLAKYQTLKIVFPEHTYYPKEILKGFCEFCDQYTFDYSIVPNINNDNLTKGTAYITVTEDDLVLLIEKILPANYKIGKDVGIISYNETPFKKIILNGITTISTDFKMMGEKAAELILNKSNKHIEVPFCLRLRGSL